MLFQRRLSLVLALFSFLTACHSSKLDVQAGKVVQQVQPHTHPHQVPCGAFVQLSDLQVVVPAVDRACSVQ